MAFAVSGWPNSPDPRTSHFGGYGWAVGAVPSFKWIVSTTNAGGPWTALNDGIVAVSIFDVLNFGSYEGFDASVSMKASVLRFSSQPPLGPTQSIRLAVDLVSLSVPRQSDAFQDYSYPNAIRVFDGFAMSLFGGGGADPFLPDPVKITPAVWDYESP